MISGSGQTAIADELQGELRDLLCLAVVGDHVRWVLSGDDVSDFAQWLAHAVEKWRAWADEVAKQLVALGKPPDGRVRSLAKDVPMNWVPDGWLQLDEAQRLLRDRVSRIAGWARARRSQMADPEIRQLFDAVCSGLEAQLTNIGTES